MRGDCEWWTSRGVGGLQRCKQIQCMRLPQGTECSPGWFYTRIVFVCTLLEVSVHELQGSVCV